MLRAGEAKEGSGMFRLKHIHVLEGLSQSQDLNPEGSASILSLSYFAR